MRRTVGDDEFDGVEGLLSGVWFTDEKLQDSDYAWNDGDDASCLYFMFNGRIYRVQEDPSDGYRSSMGPFEETGLLPVNVWEPPEEVYCEILTEWTENDDVQYYENRRCDLYRFTSKATSKPVLTFGTDHADDYYPSFVSHFQPEHLSHNQQLIDLIGKEGSED